MTTVAITGAAGRMGQRLVAHPSQLHAVPASLSDDDAVMVEPTACALHAVLRGKVGEGDTVAVIGAGTLGLLTVAALRDVTTAGNVVIAAKYPDVVLRNHATFDCCCSNPSTVNGPP